MPDRIFIDTNLWVYLFSENEEKRETVSDLIRRNIRDIQISTQILGELFNVLTKKKIAGLEEAQKIVFKISDDFPILPIDKKIVREAIDSKLRYGYSYWDSMVITSALDSQCSILYSEDLQHNQIIHDRLKITNPFIITHL